MLTASLTPTEATWVGVAPNVAWLLFRRKYYYFTGIEHLGGTPQQFRIWWLVRDEFDPPFVPPMPTSFVVTYIPP